MIIICIIFLSPDPKNGCMILDFFWLFFVQQKHTQLNDSLVQFILKPTNPRTLYNAVWNVLLNKTYIIYSVFIRQQNSC